MFQAILVRPVTVILRSFVIATALIAAAMAAEPMPAEPVQFKIAEQALASALTEFARQSDRELLFATDIVEGKQAQTVAGVYEPEEALSQLLVATGLEYSVTANDTILVAEEERGNSHSGNVTTARATPKPVMMAQAVAEQPETRQRPENDSNENGQKRPVEEIIVTGTNIRGIAPESSPLQIFNRMDIAQTGAGSVEQFMRTLPQNFGGGSTDQAREIPGDVNSTSNLNDGTSTNLRGLGSGSTLTLINGRRVASSSTIGNFVDISLIPLGAIERVEVLTDGASSIYGGDAVAGVVNFVLREDFDGAETSVRVGGSDKGGAEELKVSQAIGTAWSGGNIFGSVEWYRRDRLVRSDRPDIETVPYDDIAFQQEADDIVTLLPEQERKSVLISGSQRLSDQLKISIDGIYSERSSDRNSSLGSFLFVNVNGDSKMSSVSAALDYEFGRTWAARLDGSISEVQERPFSTIFLVPYLDLASFDRETNSELRSANLKFDGDLLSLPGGVAKAAFGFHYREEEFAHVLKGSAPTATATRDVAAIFGELQIPLVGEANAVPGIKRLELNLSGRVDDYSDFGESSNPKYGVLWEPITGLRIRGSYGTAFAPPPLGRVGAADQSGTVYNYGQLLQQLGLLSPDPALNDLNLLQLTGTAPNLDPETSTTLTYGFDYDFSRGKHAWSIGGTFYDVEYEGRLGRTPIPGNPPDFNYAVNIAYENPAVFPAGTVIFNPTQAQVDASIATFDEPALYLHGVTPADQIGIINAVTLLRNIGLTNTRGIDANLSYTLDSDAGLITASLNASKILEFSRQATVTTPSVDSLNTLYNPVDLQLTGRLGISTGPINGTLALNYRDSYQTDNTTSAKRVSSWTTFDAGLSYNFGAESGWANGLSLGLTALNILDQSPPRTPIGLSEGISGYDPANATPLGRYFALDISKKF